MATRTGLAHTRAHAVAVFLVWAGTIACEETDIGRCCTVVGGELVGKCERMEPDCPIPLPEADPNGGFKAVFALDPKFDCEELACVSYEGTKAYCTKECLVDSNCPDGFVCAQVIQSRPGPNEPPRSACVRQLDMAGTPYMCTQ